MARTCPQCGFLKPPPSWRRLLQASASEWKQLFTTPKSDSCPQCHAALYAYTTWMGHLCVIAGGIAAGLTAFIIWKLFPVNSPWGQLALVLLAFPAAIPSFVCYHRWGYVWKLCRPESGARSTPSVKEAAIPPGPAPQWGGIDRALTSGVFLLGALMLASWALLYVPRATICQPGFWGRGLLWQNSSSSVPMFWAFSGLTAFALRQRKRQRTLRARNLPFRFTVPAWSVAWATVVSVLYGLHAFTHFYRSMWLAVSMMVVMFAGLVGLALDDQRRRRAHGIPIPAGEKARLVFWALLAGVVILVAVLLPKWMQ